MSQEMNFAELQELREQFSQFNQKLENQDIIGKSLLKKVITSKLSFMEREYRNYKSICLIAMPLLTLQFIRMGFPWGFIALMDCIALVEFYLKWRGYRTLEPKQLTARSFTEAMEKVVRYKRLRLQANKILAIPAFILAVWSVLIACKYSWNLPVISVTVCCLIAVFLWRIVAERDVRKRLDEVLRHIKELKA